uniref:HD domain-containing protein n=1 Tax=viral metagenome TaxID=1070528 RepID=A0A6C0AMF1_9ZZZZ
MDSLFNFIEQQCAKYNIDESHGVKHAKGTMMRANEILFSLTGISEEERKMILYASALHDTCDSKYTPVNEAANEIGFFLRSQHWLPQDINALINIVTSMSYSKLKKSFPSGQIEFPNHGKWQRAYHVARHADLLEGYIVARCVMYNQHLFPEKTDDEHWQRASELFSERVFTYISDGWIFLPTAINIATSLEQEALKCLKERSMNWPEPVINEIKN